MSRANFFLFIFIMCLLKTKKYAINRQLRRLLTRISISFEILEAQQHNIFTVNLVETANPKFVFDQLCSSFQTHHFHSYTYMF